jgi:hypothetical protein
MKIISNRSGQPQLQKITRSLALGIILAMTVIESAHADDHGNRGGAHNRGRSAAVDRDWRDHQGRAQRYWHQPHFVPEPGVVYAPPVVYYPPPQPQYEAPGLNLIIPLHIH